MLKNMNWLMMCLLIWRRRITASSLDFQSRHSGPTPGGATTFFRRSLDGR